MSAQRSTEGMGVKVHQRSGSSGVRRFVAAPWEIIDTAAFLQWSPLYPGEHQRRIRSAERERIGERKT